MVTLRPSVGPVFLQCPARCCAAIVHDAVVWLKSLALVEERSCDSALLFLLCEVSSDKTH